MFGNFGNIFEQFKDAQEQMKKIQENLADKYVSGNAGGGKVEAVVNGRQQLMKITIDPEMIKSDPDEIALFEDMIVSAVNQANEKSRTLAAEEIGKITGGLPIQDILKKFNF